MGQGNELRCLNPKTLVEMKDCYRPLLLFAPSLHYAQFIKQMQALQGDQLRERSVLIVLVLEETPVTDMTRDVTGGLPVAAAGEAERSHLRKTFNIPRGSFTVILVGKDGGQKLRRRQVVTSLDLSRVIDAMPMRKDEIEHQGSHQGTIVKTIP